LVALIRRASALAVCITLAPLAAAAQVRPMTAEVPETRSLAPRAGADASVINWYGELQSLSAHLQQVHARALEDPALRQARDRLMAAVQRAMDAADTELPRLAQRVTQIQEEMVQARQGGDLARFQALEQERARIQARFMRVRATVLRQPEIARQSRQYEEQLRAKMIQIQPLTENLLARSRELQRLLQEALGERQPRQ
jgi:hypothetical protein